MGRAGLSMSSTFWSRHLDAIGTWLSLPGTVGYLCEPRDAQLYSRPNIESLWQSKRESHLKINVLWVETWTTKDKKWHFDFFSVSSQLSPLGFSQPSVPLWSFSWHIRVLQNRKCLSICSRIGLMYTSRILLAGVVKIQCDAGSNYAF